MKPILKYGMLPVALGAFLTATVVSASDTTTPTYETTLYGTIDATTARAYADFLSKVPDHSTVKVNVNSPGGMLYDAYELIYLNESAKKRDIKIVVRIGMMAASGAAVFACSADKIEMAEYSQILFHSIQYSNGLVGQTAVTDKNISKYDQSIKDLYYYVKKYSSRCGLTTKEMNDIFVEGKDVTISTADYKKRVGK